MKILKNNQKKSTNNRFKKNILKPTKSKKEKRKSPALKRILSIIFYELTGALLCLLILFILSGGKNFLKLYKDLNKLINVYNTISTSYYGTYDKDTLIDNAIDAMLNSIDDNYTTYSNQDSTTTFEESIEGSYEGIGCQVAKDESGNIYIVSIFSGSPAEKAGLQENDIILKIDDQDFQGKTTSEMATYIKETTNKKIKLTIKRQDQQQEITIERDSVEIQNVASEVLEKDNHKIGYIKISIFSTVATEQFKNQLEKLEKKDIEGLIIDVRDNTGGYLTTVNDILNLFLKKGQVMYQLEDNKKVKKIKDTTKEKRDYPITVLTNAASASASEILAAAIKESYKGDTVGTTTFGKGTVQKTKKLSDGTMIKYTVQKWLTPDGNWINESGVSATYFVEKDSTSKEDNQLEKALEVVLTKITTQEK